MADLTITINPPNTNTITISDGVLPHNSSHAPGGSDSVETWYAKVGDLTYVSGQIGSPAGVVLTTGDQNISGVKNFYSRPTVNGSGVMLTGETAGTGYLTGYVNKSETGSFVSSGNTGSFVTTSQTGQFTGVFYPYSANPAAYVQGAVVRPSNTGDFVDKGSSQIISGLKNFTKAITAPTGVFSIILGGSGNSVVGDLSSVLGGLANSVNASFSSIVGGESSFINDSSRSFIAGGNENALVSTENSFIGVGYQNSITLSNSSAILGGFLNTITNGSDGSIVGNENSIIDSFSSVSIGFQSEINSSTDAFSIGRSNVISGVVNSLVLASSGVSSGSHTAVISYPSGIFLEGPAYFNNRPTYNGTGFLLSGEASAASTGYLTGYTPIADSITGIAVNGSSTKTITLYQYDGSTLTASFTDQQGIGGSGEDLYIYSGSFNTADGNLTLNRTGDAGTVIVSLDGRYVTGSVVRPSETGAFLTTGAADTRYTLQSSTGAYTGAFYPRFSNPSGYITGVDLSSYATTASVTGVSGYQSGLISNLQSATGNLNTRVTTVEGVTGTFALSTNTGSFLTTGAGDARYYPLSSNPSSYLVASDIVNLASTGYVTGVSGYLQGQINTLTGQTGSYVTGSVVRPSETGQFYAASNPSGYITGVDLSPYATTSFVTGISGYYSGLITSLQTTTGNINTRLTSVEGVTGSFTLSANTGAFLTTGAADSRYALQSATGSYTGVFYPLSTNPSGYITGVDLSSYATIAFATGISGFHSGLISSLQSSTGTLNTRLTTVESVTGSFARIPYVAEIYIDAGAMLTGLSGASSTTTTVNSLAYDGYNFDSTTTGFSQFKVILSDYNLGDMRAKFVWTATGTGSVIWGIQSLGVGDGESLNPTWSVAQEVTDTYITGSGLHKTSSTSPFIPSGSIQSGDSLFFRVYRNASSASDTISSNATLLGISLQYTGASISTW